MRHKVRGRCSLYSLVIFIVTAANDASSLSFRYGERGTKQERYRAERPIRVYARRGARRWRCVAGRGEKSTTGPSRVARTIKKRASAQILAGSKLPEKRNKRWIRGPPLNHPLLPTRPLSALSPTRRRPAPWIDSRALAFLG